MFDDVLKGAKKAKSSDKPKSKNNKVEKIKPVASETKDPAPEDMSAEVLTTSTPRKRKSTGKRTDPSYKQVGAYIKKDTYLQIQKLLLDKPDKDFSDLVQELLSTYLDNQLTD